MISASTRWCYEIEATGYLRHRGDHREFNGLCRRNLVFPKTRMYRQSKAIHKPTCQMVFGSSSGAPASNTTDAEVGTSKPAKSCTTRLALWSCEKVRNGRYSSIGEFTLIDPKSSQRGICAGDRRGNEQAVIIQQAVYCDAHLTPQATRTRTSRQTISQ